MHIVYAAPLPRISPEHRDQLNQLGSFELVRAQSFTDDQAIASFKAADVLALPSSAVKYLSEKILSALPNLKYITTTTSGCDWIDLTAASKLGIVVSNCPGGNAQSVAEHTLGMIIDLSKRITEADRAVRQTSAFNFADFRGREIHGKTFGLLGLGHVGARVATMSQAFSLQVLGFDLVDKQLPGVTQVDLPTLISQSDIIAILLPLSSATTGLIGESEIKAMKNGVILVNTSREAIMDKSAVLSGLASGKIFGLGVDAAIMTQLSADDPYFAFPNVIITPHNAFCTTEADANVQQIWVENIRTFMANSVQNRVN